SVADEVAPPRYSPTHGFEFAGDTKDLKKHTDVDNEFNNSQENSNDKIGSGSGQTRNKFSKLVDFNAKINAAELKHWGPSDSRVYKIVMQYWINTHIVDHWLDLRESKPATYFKLFNQGYCEPISEAWANNRTLGETYADILIMKTGFLNLGEERLYYLLNHLKIDGIPICPDPIRPLKFNSSFIRYDATKRGTQRANLGKPIDSEIIRLYASPHDAFLSIPTKSREYSHWMPHKVNETRKQMPEALAEDIKNGSERIEIMLLVDMSSSMTVNPQNGVFGRPDGIRRVLDQPCNIDLVKNLIRRLLKHMVPRNTQLDNPGAASCAGIPKVTFATHAEFIGNLNTKSFDYDWSEKVVQAKNFGGIARIMRGWQVVKKTYFEKMQTLGHGYHHPHYGWQATPGMPKLSLLIILDGEPNNICKFKLDLLEENWVLATILLVGYENCPYHHSNAIELERMRKYNLNVECYDVQGHVLERLIVENLLNSVYPYNPPTFSEIVDPANEI
ncbi:hypothetical protein HK100_007937, partial [Physocladia obscura]